MANSPMLGKNLKGDTFSFLEPTWGKKKRKGVRRKKEEDL